MSQSSGGPSAGMLLMERALAAVGIEVSVAATDDDGPNKHFQVPLGVAINRNYTAHYYFRKQTEFYKISLPLHCWLKAHVCEYDVVHIHALFSFASVAGAWRASNERVPYVIFPHGVLNRYGLTRRRRWLKRLSLQLIERKMLGRAAAMHYTSDQERVEAEEAGATAPAFVIPHGIDISSFLNLSNPECFFAKWPQARNREIILFLSRIDPKKGLDLLLDALVSVKQRHPQALLVVAGKGETLFERSLHNRVSALNLNDHVLWTGFLTEEEKLSVMAASRAFVLPSRSENFALVIAEALASGQPCIVTEGVAVSQDIRERDAGIVVKPEVEPLCEAMNRLLGDAALRERLSANAKKLAQAKFSLDSMGAGLKRLYASILLTPNGSNV